MRVQVVGIERSKGTSSKTNKPYDMGTLHVITKLAERSGENDLAKGFMGDSLRVSSDIVRKIEHLPFPVACDLAVEDVMRFGKRETNVLDCVPIALAEVPARKAA